MAEKAPASPTPVYTRLFTNRVEGFVREEKKVACRDAFSSLPLISSKAPNT